MDAQMNAKYWEQKQSGRRDVGARRRREQNDDMRPEVNDMSTLVGEIQRRRLQRFDNIGSGSKIPGMTRTRPVESGPTVREDLEQCTTDGELCNDRDTRAS